MVFTGNTMIRTETYTANDPIHGLQLHAGESACITMSRIHQGVPLYDRVKILEIRTDALLMQAQNSLVLVDSAGTIHLHSEHLPYPIQGQMLDQDLSKSLFLLGELPPNQKEVFLLNEMEDMTLQQIADQTGEKLKTIISRKGYAVKHLRNKLNYLYLELTNNK